MKDNNYKEMISQRKEQAESQTKEYFYNQKQRKAYYWAEGDMYNGVDNPNAAYIHFTDEEVLRIRSLIVAEANSYLNNSEPFTTMEEALEVLSYGELLEQNEELRDLILDRCKEADLYPTDISTPNTISIHLDVLPTITARTRYLDHILSAYACQTRIILHFYHCNFRIEKVSLSTICWIQTQNWPLS